jgi:cell division septum initiation protein DivIVA
MPGTVWLTDRATGREVPLAAEDVAAALGSGKFLDPGAVAVHQNGMDTYAAPDVARQDATITPAIDPALAARALGHSLRQSENSGVAAGGRAFVGGLASGASAGLLSPFADEQEFNAIAAGAGNLIGAVAPALVGDEAGLAGLARYLPSSLAARAGAGVAGRLGGGIAARIAGGATEGGLFGVGQGVHELATSRSPLTAESIASTLSSNVMLGGTVGGIAGATFASIERGLQRAGTAIREATAARSTLESMPGELAGLDDAGLVAARKEAAAAHAADIESEKASLEQLRTHRRAELADQVRDLHNDIASERPVFHAVQGDDVAEIPGVSDIKVQMAKSFKSMRGAFDSPIGVARDPTALLKPLEQRQAALEALQAKAPELQAKLAGDKRADVLAHVDDVLAQTKAQIQEIQALSQRNPVTGARLTTLTSGPSTRMQQIDAAREALKQAPELGLVGKAATGAAFAGGTALAHMIPGVGFAAPFVGKGAADAVGSLFTRLAGGARAAASRLDGTAEKFLATAAAATKAAPAGAAAAALSARDVLSRVRFGPEERAAPGGPGDELGQLFAKRAAELRRHTELAPDGSIQMRQDARLQLTRKLAPIAAVNPQLADQVETVQARKIAFLASKIPKHPEVGGLQVGPDKWRPSDLAIRSFARTVRACEDPAGVEDRLAQAKLTPEDAEAYRACYPERFAALQRRILEAAPLLSKSLSTAKKVALFTFTGIPTMPALQRNVLGVIQGQFKVEPGTQGGTAAPKPLPAFGALGSPRSQDQPTPSQKRGG